MKKLFFLLLLAAALVPNDARACIGISTHNYYLFDILDGSFSKERRITERCNQFWQNYTKNEVNDYLWNKETVMEIAKKRGDRELMNYMTELNKYLDISEQLGDSWTYPTKAELAQRQETLRQMAAKAFAYKGARLKSQWALLYMRANMLMKKHQTNINYWKNTGSKLPQSVYREMMENIYAGALLHAGQRKAAVELFTQQGDFTSVRWLLRKARNVEGIRSVYNEDPTSPSLLFLVQDFVNNAQETIDNTGEDKTIDEDWIKTINARVVRKADSEQFIRFAKQVINEGKNPYPAMWQAAIGELQYLNGDAKTAIGTLTKAMSMKGTQRMQDNARVIRLVAAVKGKRSDKDFSQWMVNEMNWLIAKGNEAKKENEYSQSIYHRAMERLVYEEMIPMYQKEGNTNMATSLYSMMNEGDRLWTGVAKQEQNQDWNDNYQDWAGYSTALGELNGDQLVAYAKWLKQNPSDEMERFVKQRINDNQTYFNDMAGTRYIAEGKFEKAIPLLKTVPLTFMESQNISFYLAKRNYTIGRWFGRQKFGKNVQTEGPHLAKLNHNPKLAFCEEILQLQAQYSLATGTERQRLALQLARRYYQVSHNGDCWYITHYGHSWGDTAKEGEMDFVNAARKLLQESSASSDFDTRQESLFALAFIPEEATGEHGGWGDDKPDWKSVANNRDQTALANLAAFYQQNRNRVARYITKCDVLAAFQ